jgi:hypothetical protein
VSRITGSLPSLAITTVTGVPSRPSSLNCSHISGAPVETSLLVGSPLDDPLLLADGSEVEEEEPTSSSFTSSAIAGPHAANTITQARRQAMTAA